MKKNISINIGGIIFHLEEDGYETLRHYLDTVNRYFSSFEDSSEILADIESRIAEIFLTKLNEGKQVITAEDVRMLIATMGSVRDFKAAEEETEFATAEENQEEQRKNHKESYTTGSSKKLYRDNRRKVLGGICAGLGQYFDIDPIWPRLLIALLILGSYGGLLFVYIILWILLPGTDSFENESGTRKMYRDGEKRVIGGVASGVAAYFGIDITLARVLFVLFIFAGGLAFLTYIILWIALPEAKTLTEKMQMAGEPVTLSNIESSVKKGINEKEGEESVWATIVLFPFRIIATIIEGLGRILGPLFRVSIDVLRIVIGVILGLMGMLIVLCILGIFFGAFSIITLPFGGDATLNFPIEALRNTIPIIPLIAGFVALFIPSLALLLGGVSVIANRSVLSPVVGWPLFVSFFISLAVLGFTLPAFIYSFKESGEYQRELSFDRDGHTTVLKINEIGLDDYEVATIYIKGHNESNIRVVEFFRSRGANRMEAAENAQMVNYTVSNSDSILIFDSSVTFENGAQFKGQEVDIDLYLPYNQPFIIEGSLWRIIATHYSRQNYYAHHNTNQTWQLTEDGLECLTCLPGSQREGEKDQFGFSNFNEISLTGIINSRIVQSNEYAIELTGPSALRNRYRVNLDGETLNVDFDSDSWSFWERSFSGDTEDLTITIMLPHLENLSITGAGHTSISGFNEPEMKIKLLGASIAECHMNVQRLFVEATGASKIELSGGGDFLEAELTGASGLKAYGYPVRTGVIEATGASSAEVNATETIEMSSGVASRISYQGNPKIIRQE